MVKIFVGNLSSSATKEDLRSLFSQYGKVAECDVLRNFGFVHMDTQKEAEEAVRKLHHHELNGQAINVEMSRGKPKGTTKLHVGNISSSCTNQELREKFAEFGSVVECDIVKDYAFVHMERREDAMEAISALDNATFQGKVINVQLSTSRLRTVPGMGDITGCYVCGEPGHWSKACRRGQNGSYGGGGGGGGSPMGGIRATSGFPRAGPAYSSGVPAAFPSRSYSATLPPIPTVSYTPSYGISRDYTAETRYLSKPTAVYTERSITYERDPSRYAAEYYEKFRAQPLGSSYLEDRRISIPPPPPLSSSSLSRMRLAPSSLDPYDRRALPPPSSAASAYFSRDRSPIRRVGAGSEGYSYERSRLSPVSRSSSYSVSHSRDTPTDRARYNY
ncbi:RNA binding motif protein 4 like isoform X1 [Silurus meridionalis]|nr:RNA binding motif protein 4 like isoform X1 [Silurus meridionalis]